MKRAILFVLMLTSILILVGCSPASETPQITIEEPWARAAMQIPTEMEGMGENHMEGDMHAMGGGGTSAVYMTIKNSGQQADKLLEARTDAAEIVETHVSETRDGVTVMAQVNGIEVPGRGEVELKPGGLHIMLINLNQDLMEGDSISLTLVFEQSGEIQVSVPVQAP
jgi:periplasmic copper chaperone A